MLDVSFDYLAILGSPLHSLYMCSHDRFALRLEAVHPTVCGRALISIFAVHP